MLIFNDFLLLQKNEGLTKLLHGRGKVNVVKTRFRFRILLKVTPGVFPARMRETKKRRRHSTRRSGIGQHCSPGRRRWLLSKTVKNCPLHHGTERLTDKIPVFNEWGRSLEGIGMRRTVRQRRCRMENHQSNDENRLTARGSVVVVVGKTDPFPHFCGKPAEEQEDNGTTPVFTDKGLQNPVSPGFFVPALPFLRRHRR